jgi:multiple sugar transport system permease protein
MTTTTMTTPSTTGTTRSTTPRRKDAVASLVLHVLLVAGLIAMVGPFIWMVLSSLKQEGEIREVPPTWLPRSPNFDNYRAVFDRLDFAQYAFNSIFVAVAITLGNVVFCSALGYALAKLDFPGRRALFATVMGTLMVPGTAIFVPLFVLVANLGMVNSYGGLILPFLVGAFGVFLMRQFIMSIPDDLLEAARIDGAGELRIFWQIVLPLCRPALATLGILTFLSSWNNFLWPLVVATTEDMYTLPVGLALFSVGQDRTEYGPILAFSVMVVLPILLVFIALQRLFTRGIAMTGLK